MSKLRALTEDIIVLLEDEICSLVLQRDAIEEKIYTTTQRKQALQTLLKEVKDDIANRET